MLIELQWGPLRELRSQVRLMKSKYPFSFIADRPWGTTPLGVETDRWQLYSIAYARTGNCINRYWQSEHEMWAPRFQPGYNPPGQDVSQHWQKLKELKAETGNAR